VTNHKKSNEFKGMIMVASCDASIFVFMCRFRRGDVSVDDG